MQKITIHIEPSNGLSLPDIGHLAHGNHDMEVSAAQLSMLQTAEGLSIEESNATPPSSSRNKPSNTESLATDIREAIAELNPDNETLWTKSGKAKTEALETILGYQITAAERDAAL